MSRPAFTWRMGEQSLALGARTLIMGVINVTPDSFSDGGRFRDPVAAVAQGIRLLGEGADLLDVGGETTRPGSAPTPLAEELARVLPVVEGLCRQRRPLISVDTYKAEVARQALAAGAAVINDITALRGDPAMVELAAASGAGLILMHMRGEPRTMQENPVYGDVVGEVAEFLAERAEFAQARGVRREAIVLDPGIGFGKTLEHNLALIAGLPRLAALGYPLLLAASRKTFIGKLTGRPPAERLHGTLGVHVLGAARGAHLVRVHDVAPMREALSVVDPILAREG